MISTLFTITNKAGDSFTFNDHVTDPVNFIALQTYPQFEIDIKNNEIEKEGQHGIWDFYSFYGRRTINFQGVIVGEDEASIEAQKETILSVLGFPAQPTADMDGVVYLRWTDLAGNDWEIECKLLASVRFDRALRDHTLLEFIFSLKAPSPFILGQTVYSEDGVRGWKTTGLKLPTILPAMLDADYNFTATLLLTESGGSLLTESGEILYADIDTNVNNSLDIFNTGTIDADTVIRLYGEAQGPVTNPKISNVSTGKTFYLSITLADETEWVEIDSKEGTVVDQDGADLSGFIVGVSEFIVLAPGNNNLLYESDENPAQVLYLPTAVFNVQYRDTKI